MDLASYPEKPSPDGKSQDRDRAPRMNLLRMDLASADDRGPSSGLGAINTQTWDKEPPSRKGPESPGPR
eukprot:8808138-Pyramimonas_sp.AAC.1